MKIFVVILLAILFASINAQTDAEKLLNGPQQKVIKCTFTCLYSQMTFQEAMRIIGKCSNEAEPLPCFAKEVGGKVFTCVQECWNAEAKRVAALAPKSVEPKGKNTIKCIYKCMKTHLKPRTILKIVSQCKTDKKCYLSALKGKAKECASGCLQVAGQTEGECAEKVTKARKHFKGLDRSGKREFVKKLYKGLTEKYPETDKKLVGKFIAALLFKRVPAQKVCDLYKKIFKNNNNNQVTIVDKKAGLFELVRYSTTLDQPRRKQLTCLFDCLSEKFTPAEILRIVGKCFSEEDPLMCIAAQVGEPLFACVSKCFMSQKKTFTSGVAPKCTQKVEKVRTYFAGLNKKEKKAFFKKVVAKLAKKHENVPRKKIAFFTASLLFSRVPAAVPCKLYKRLFGQEIEIASIKCAKKCVKKHLKWRTALKIIAKCRLSKGCYLKSLGGKALECVKSCF